MSIEKYTREEAYSFFAEWRRDPNLSERHPNIGDRDSDDQRLGQFLCNKLGITNHKLFYCENAQKCRNKFIADYTKGG